MTGAGLAVRPYARRDFDACLALFDGNVPAFFAPGERAEFAAFLSSEPLTGYLVLERRGAAVAAGGVSLGADGWVTLDWGMVARPLQGQGLGRELLEARLALARAMPGACGLRLETSQKTRGFYEAFGFRAGAVVPEGFGPGLDAVAMALRF